MKKNLIIPLVMLLATTFSVVGQTKYFTRNGKISFDANTKSSPDKIEAKNEKATSILDVSTGQLDFAVLMKAFIFEKALMQEHFNENYMESDKFPKATFKGTIKNMNEDVAITQPTHAGSIPGKDRMVENVEEVHPDFKPVAFPRHLDRSRQTHVEAIQRWRPQRVPADDAGTNVGVDNEARVIQRNRSDEVVGAITRRRRYVAQVVENGHGIPRRIRIVQRRPIVSRDAVAIDVEAVQVSGFRRARLNAPDA